MLIDPSSPHLSFNPIPFARLEENALINRIAKEIFFPENRHIEDVAKCVALRELDQREGDIVIISKEKKPFLASLHVLQAFAKTYFFKAQWSAEGKAFTFPLTSKTIHFYLDLLYGVDPSPFPILLEELLELFYLTDFIGDKKNFIKTKMGLLRLFKEDLSLFERAWELSKQSSLNLMKLLSSLLKENESLQKLLHLKESLDKGDSNAALFLGDLLSSCQVMKRAIFYYKQAESKGVIEASFKLGEIFRKQKDFKEMIHSFTQAAEKGHLKSQLALAAEYTLQFDLRDPILAKKYYLMAAEKQDAWAEYNLGLIALKEEDQKLAIKYLLKAAKQGSRHACYTLKEMGFEYQNGQLFKKVPNSFWEFLISGGDSYHEEHYQEEPR